jgi:cytidylate kinase
VAIVTISRGSLSGGRAVAECLAERLGWRCLAEEILDGAAESIGTSQEVLKAKFETTPGLWARAFRERERYLLAVRTSLVEACLTGDLVYHGLAGQLLLSGLPGVLRVRLIAPLEMRLGALTRQRHRMTREAAEEFIDSVDQERRRWVRVTFGVDVEDPSLYDLTVNLKVLTLDAACAAIAEAAALPEYEINEPMREEWAALAASLRARRDAMMGES